MTDTCIPEEKKLKDPRRLYAPGRLYHIVERKPFRYVSIMFNFSYAQLTSELSISKDFLELESILYFFAWKVKSVLLLSSLSLRLYMLWS